MRGFDVKESGVNRDIWLNGAVCAYRDDCTVFAEYGGFMRVVIFPR